MSARKSLLHYQRGKPRASLSPSCRPPPSRRGGTRRNRLDGPAELRPRRLHWGERRTLGKTAGQGRPPAAQISPPARSRAGRGLPSLAPAGPARPRMPAPRQRLLNRARPFMQSQRLPGLQHLIPPSSRSRSLPPQPRRPLRRAPAQAPAPALLLRPHSGRPQPTVLGQPSRRPRSCRLPPPRRTPTNSGRCGASLGRCERSFSASAQREKPQRQRPRGCGLTLSGALSPWRRRAQLRPPPP